MATYRVTIDHQISQYSTYEVNADSRDAAVALAYDGKGLFLWKDEKYFGSGTFVEVEEVE